jgi:hypothetical protein
MKSCLVLLLCLLGMSVAKDYPVDITLTQGLTGPAFIEVRTSDKMETGGEMRFILYRTDDAERTFEARVAPPVERGLYRLEYPFETGSWEMQLRFGTGIDLYETWASFYVEPGERTLKFRNMFYGTLGPNTPSYVQPLGFGVFTLMLGVALTLVVAVLRWLKKQGEGQRVRAEG